MEECSWGRWRLEVCRVCSTGEIEGVEEARAGTSWVGECWKFPGLRPRKMSLGDIFERTKWNESSTLTTSDSTSL